MLSVIFLRRRFKQNNNSQKPCLASQYDKIKPTHSIHINNSELSKEHRFLEEFLNELTPLDISEETAEAPEAADTPEEAEAVAGEGLLCDEEVSIEVSEADLKIFSNIS